MARAVTEDDESTEALTTSRPGVAAEEAVPQGDDTAEEIARLQDEIARRRRRLDAALHQLEHRVSEDLDWRRRVAAHPWVVLTAAALAGFTIGRFTGPRSPKP